MSQPVSDLLVNRKPGLPARFVLRLKRKNLPPPPPSIGALPLSIQPDPEYFIESPVTPFRRIVSLIERSDGGVFAVTGVRGAGKSVLLNSIAKHFDSRYHTLYLTAPISSGHGLDFFMAMFRLLCDSVNAKLRRTILKEVLDLRTIGKRESRRQALYLLCLTVLLLGVPLLSVTAYQNVIYRRNMMAFVDSLQLRTCVSLPATSSASGTATSGKATSGTGTSGTATSGRATASAAPGDIGRFCAQLTAATSALKPTVWTLDNSDISRLLDLLETAPPSELFSFSKVMRAPPGFYAAALYIVILGVSVACYAFLWLLFRFYRRWRRYSRHQSGMGLLLSSASISEYLDYELTRSDQSELSVPLLKGLTARLGRSRELKARSITLPSLTEQYISFTEQLLEVFPNKLIICIDELDKVTDLNDVRAILRQIKGGLYVKGCFYIISLSEDAQQAFGNRLSATRDLFESTFDEICPIGRLSSAACRDILRKRVTEIGRALPEVGAADDVMLLCATLSAGIPRDLVRHFRECVLENDALENIDVQAAWRRLFQRKVAEVTSDVLSSVGLDPLRADLLKALTSLGVVDQQDISLRAIADCIQIQVALLQARLTDSVANSEKGSGEAQAIRAWIRSWIELRIYVAAGFTVLRKADGYRASLEHIRSAYSMLPYSLETCETRLSSVYPDWPTDIVAIQAEAASA